MILTCVREVDLYLLTDTIPAKMKWNDVFILIAGEGPNIEFGLKVLKHRYHVPADRCFNFCPAPLEGSVPASRGCLSRVRLSSKLFLLGHGLPRSFTIAGKLYFPDSLALFLRDFGLREAGLISFKSCQIGEHNFLNDFLSGLGRYGVKVGWLKGYTEGVRPCGHRWVINSEIRHLDNIEVEDNLFDKFDNDLRVKVIPGNIGAYPLKQSSRYPDPRSRNGGCCVII